MMKKEYKIIALVVIGLSIWWIVPQKQVNLFGIGTNNTIEKATLENQYRVTITQMFGGIAILYGVYQGWQRINIAEKELKVSQEGQITERFTRAIDQLGATDKSGNSNLEIRLGGIYALERIANESEKDYWPIMEILTAYVRKNSA
jgi:hypothetical protein